MIASALMGSEMFDNKFRKEFGFEADIKEESELKNTQKPMGYIKKLIIAFFVYWSVVVLLIASSQAALILLGAILIEAGVYIWIGCFIGVCITVIFIAFKQADSAETVPINPSSPSTANVNLTPQEVALIEEFRKRDMQQK